MTNLHTATFCGGCFWCTMRPSLPVACIRLNRVIPVDTAPPTCREVCSDESGHAEVVQVHLDPAVIDYTTPLAMFFTLHDPTQLNRQGNDIGSQYRSVVYYHDSAQSSRPR